MEYKWSVGEMPQEIAAAFAQGTAGQAIAEQAGKIEKLVLECRCVGVPKWMVREALQTAGALETLTEYKRRALAGDNFNRERSSFAAARHDLAESMAALRAEIEKATNSRKAAEWLTNAIMWIGWAFAKATRILSGRRKR